MDDAALSPVEERELTSLLELAASQARALGIPVSGAISPDVRVNRRAKKRLGCCTGNIFGFSIEVSASLLSSGRDAVLETLAHEVLHTARGCRNHGERWKKYAAMMNAAYGYSITRVKAADSLGEEKAEERYLLVCERCGAQFPRLKKSALVLHPERYHCRCGGSIKRVK